MTGRPNCVIMSTATPVPMKTEARRWSWRPPPLPRWTMGGNACHVPTTMGVDLRTENAVTCFVLLLPDRLLTEGSIGGIGRVDFGWLAHGVRQAIDYVRLRPNVLCMGGLRGRAMTATL